MTKPSPKEITQLLLAWSHGQQAALNQLLPPVKALDKQRAQPPDDANDSAR